MSSCSIDYDGDYASVYVEKHITKARKQHTCIECHEKIEICQSYTRIFLIFDGECSNYKICDDCKNVRETFGNGAIGDLWQELEESICNCGGNVCFENLDNLTPKALEKVITILDENFEEYE